MRSGRAWAWRWGRVGVGRIRRGGREGQTWGSRRDTRAARETVGTGSISRSNVLNARWRRGEISTRPIHARPLVTSTPRRMTHPRLFLLGVGVPADAPLTHGARVKTLTRGKGTSRHTGRAFSSKARALSAYASDDGRPVNDVNDFWRVDDGQNLMGGSTG